MDEDNKSMLRTAHLNAFVGNILRQSAPPVTILLACLAHIEKVLKITGSLPSHWSCERVFLGALLLAFSVRLSAIRRGLTTDDLPTLNSAQMRLPTMIHIGPA